MGWNGFVDRSERRAPTPSSIAGVSHLAVRWAVLLVVGKGWGILAASSNMALRAVLRAGYDLALASGGGRFDPG